MMTRVFVVFVTCILAVSCTLEASKDNGPVESELSNEASQPRSMTVFCGSASKPPMEEIAASFKKDRGVDVNLIFGGSGTLLSQLELSKKGEIYLPGSPDYISIGLRKKLLIEGSDRRVAYLVPSMITPAENPAGIEKLEDLKKPGIKIGIGNPKSVCLGLYGIELIEKAGVMEEILRNVSTYGGSCSKTANLASLNQVDVILGWRVFASWNPKRMKAIPIDPTLIPRISYIPISIPVHTKDRKLSEMFIDYVLSDKGLDVYAKYGYISDIDKAKKFAPNATVGGEYKLPDDFFRITRELAGQ